jgi:threonine/homoserine/homoserine lactone efflux protein
VLALTALRHVPTGFARALQVIGGLMLLYFAFAIVRKISAGRPDTNDHDASAPRSLAQAVAVNVANPGPYLGWSLVLGPEVTRLWPTQPAAALAIVACFYLVLTVGNALTIIAFGGLRAFGPERMRALLPVSAAVLGALGIYRIVISLT